MFHELSRGNITTLRSEEKQNMTQRSTFNVVWNNYAPQMQKYGEPTNDSNYGGSCTLRRFRFGTFKTIKQLNICWTECKNTYRTENYLDGSGCGLIE